MARSMLFLALTWALVTVGASHVTGDEDHLAGRARPIAPADVGVGRWTPDVTFQDLDGVTHTLHGVAKDGVTVVAITNLTCPVSRRYAPRLGTLSKTPAFADVAFVFVDPSPQDDSAELRAAAKRHGWRGLVVHDKALRLVRALGARTTAEVFVFDDAHTLVYRGALDDQYGVGFARPSAERTYAADALRAVLAGHRPDAEATTAPGCVLDTGAKQPSEQAPTYHRDVARVLQRHCVACHRAGEAAPFPLTSFAEVKPHAAMIKWVVQERRMPPWNAGPDSLPMAHTGHLSDDERTRLTSWVDAGTPEGDPRDAPTPRTWPEGWKIGTPDVIVEIPRAQPVPAEGVVKYRHVTVPTDFGEDKWVAAYEIRPTAPEVVHHVLVFARYPRKHPRAHEQPRVRGGIDGYFAAMVPGQSAYRFPAHTGRFLPRGTRLRFQLHYTPNGTATTDKTRLGIIFAKERPTHEVRSLGVHNTRIRIPAGAADHVERSSKVVSRRARLLGFTPHMHLRGKAFRFEIERPGGGRETVLDVPNYDFNWQFHYALREPLDVPAGTRIHVTARYDNSKDNPHNPDPSVRVRWGDQTFDEMLIGYVEWHPLTR